MVLLNPQRVAISKIFIPEPFFLKSCVISNAFILKSKFPETLISVDSSCCAGVSPESHNRALESMKTCQIMIH